MDLTGIAGLFIHLLSFTRPHFVHPLIMYPSDLLDLMVQGRDVSVYPKPYPNDS
jgi:hypothetical protein